VQRHVAKRSVPPTTEAQREGRAKGQMQTISIRLDDESLNMLAALMQDEERSSQSEMIRVLMKRAYRALVAQRSVREDTLPEVPNTDQNEEPARQRHVAHNLP
jgi:Arc/MetJ-type ribon-helix-helix transcriptional regulator